MSAVLSSLTIEQRKKLRSMFHRSKLSLLFKASVHGYHSAYFHQKCDRQGPTVAVAYNNSGYVFGAFTNTDYAQTETNVVDNKAFLFSFNDRMGNADPLRVFSENPQFTFHDGNTGPNFGSLFFIYNNTATVYSNPGQYFQFDPMQMHGNNLNLTEFEVYRVEDYGDIMDKPWRNVQWTPERRKEISCSVSEWKPSVSSVKQARILMVGPVGAGKSSFFNSINSVFKGYVSTQANTGIASSSLTTQFRTYRIKAGKENFLPMMLCDTMGLEEGVNAGMDIDDFTNILKGHIQDKYQFNPSAPLQDDSPHFHKSPSLKDAIHCVVYVIDTCKVKILSKKMIEKFVILRKKANQLASSRYPTAGAVDKGRRGLSLSDSRSEKCLPESLHQENDARGVW
ncbi:interferon-induced protein 44-like isoform X2 [Paramisgurnus dabryanus]|uniref:interferon-induced protein 44-like isoform X2 n=1 Tax=Paramisgurnus dabryanus TaxID=90735 RepID=UPI0031F340F4